MCLRSRLFDREPLQAECLSGITSTKKLRSQAQDRNSCCKDSHQCSDGVSTIAFLYASSVRADWSNAEFSPPSPWVQQSVGFFGEDSIPKRVQLAQRLRLPLQTQNPGYLWLQPKNKAQLSRARRCSSKASIPLVRARHNPLYIKLNHSHMLPQAYHNHHYNRKYHLTIKLPRQAPILRLSTNYLNSQNTNHDIIQKVQPETLKYLTEVFYSRA